MSAKGRLVVVFFALFISASLQAQATRTWVSGVGDDANPCSRTAPCKTFAGAISKTAASGEINALDPGGYGAVTITKSITIDGAGTNASVLNAGGVNGFVVNAGVGDRVTIRNVSINGAGSGLKGIRILGAKEVNIENVVIFRQGANQGRGVEIATSAANVVVNIVDSVIRDSADAALVSAPPSGSVMLTLDNVRIYGNTFSAVELVQNTKANISNCVFSNNGGAGVFAMQSSVEANLYNTHISSNGWGIYSGYGGNPTVRISGCIITDNTTQGLFLNGGSILSWGNNYIAGNGGNEFPTGGALQPR